MTAKEAMTQVRFMEIQLMRDWIDVKGWPDCEIFDLYDYISELFFESYPQAKINEGQMTTRTGGVDPKVLPRLSTKVTGCVRQCNEYSVGIELGAV